MDYFISGTVPAPIEFNQNSYGLYLLGEYGESSAIGFKSGINDFKKGTLSISVQIEFYADRDGDGIWVARGRQVSFFEFENPGLLKRGPTKKAISILKECTDLAQAYCYANFSFEGSRNKLPMMPSIVQPFIETEKAIMDFLAKHNELKKK
ncbi:hypothetical protein [Dyadobacter bucti]|uniref:hypothetical protein n=1 Tax=Dyadobacter bucti TaxID=2572203 RepID=UPI0011082B3A|nr:hypothetical protein [Dyadobacter bucti]